MKKEINKQTSSRRLHLVLLWLTFTAYGGCGEDDKLGWPAVLPGQPGRAPWAGLQGQRGLGWAPTLRAPLPAHSIAANTNRLSSWNGHLCSPGHHSGGTCLPRDSSGKAQRQFVGVMAWFSLLFPLAELKSSLPGLPDFLPHLRQVPPLPSICSDHGQGAAPTHTMPGAMGLSPQWGPSAPNRPITLRAELSGSALLIIHESRQAS